MEKSLLFSGSYSGDDFSHFEKTSFKDMYFKIPHTLTDRYHHETFPSWLVTLRLHYYNYVLYYNENEALYKAVFLGNLGEIYRRK